MSIWWATIKNQEDVELSDDKQAIEIMFMEDYNGANYIEVPVKFLLKELEKLNKRDYPITIPDEGTNEC